MKKLLLLTLMLLSVSSFAQYNLIINSRGDSLFVFEDDTAMVVNGHIYYKLKTNEDIKYRFNKEIEINFEF